MANLQVQSLTKLAQTLNPEKFLLEDHVMFHEQKCPHFQC